VYHAKQHLKKVLNDSIFRKLYADKELRTTFDDKLIQLEWKWNRTDSVTKANLDTLNALKVRLSDNSLILSNMLNVMDKRLDRTVPRLFGQEVNCLWQKDSVEVPAKRLAKSAISIVKSEQNAIGFYFSQTSGERTTVLVLGMILFLWLFLKRKLIRTLRAEKEKYSYLNLQYLNNHPITSILVVLLSLMPFFDAYAPTSYISIEFIFLLLASTRLLIKEGNRVFLFNWFVLVVLFASDILTYLLIEPTLMERLLQLAIHGGIIAFVVLFYRSLQKDMPFYKFIKMATLVSLALIGSGIVLNLFGRFSLSGMVGVAAVFAVTQAVVLTVFVEVVVEIILIQLQGSRLKKGVDKPFDSGIVISKIKMPLILLAIMLWCVMLSSNLNIYRDLSKGVVEALTITRTIGSISFQLLSVILFFVIIWFAHILQRLLSFLFGETGVETEDVTATSKGQHSRLLITRLLVLIGGYLLAIAASGLPIDKLTFLLGALGVGIGMGLQNIVNNFVSGIILIFDGSLQIGDEIEVNGQAGKVKEIGLRASTLFTADGAEVIIPNGNILSQNIVNWTFSNDEKRIMLSFTLSGKELDANVVNEVINDTLKNIPNVVAKRNPVILYTKVTPESCAITVRFWSTISHADLVKSEAMQLLSATFNAKKIGFE
jgi:potassium efflux system protein